MVLREDLIFSPERDDEEGRASEAAGAKAKLFVCGIRVAMSAKAKEPSRDIRRGACVGNLKKRGISFERVEHGSFGHVGFKVQRRPSWLLTNFLRIIRELTFCRYCLKVA